jgi:hypothetical protein
MKNMRWRVRLIVRHGAGSWVKLDTSPGSYRRLESSARPSETDKGEPLARRLGVHTAKTSRTLAIESLLRVRNT